MRWRHREVKRGNGQHEQERQDHDDPHGETRRPRRLPTPRGKGTGILRAGRWVHQSDAIRRFHKIPHRASGAGLDFTTKGTKHTKEFPRSP